MKIPPPHYFQASGFSFTGLRTRGLSVKSLGQPPTRCASRFYEVRSEPLFPRLCRGRGILSKRQRKILIFAFLGLENCTWRLTSRLFFPWEKQSRKTRLSDVAVRGGRELAVKAGDTRPRGGSGALRHLCISVLRLHYSCYTNKLFRPCPEQTPECGGFIRGYIFPLASYSAIKTASQRCELTFLRYAQIEVINLFMTSTKCSTQGQDWCGRVHSRFAARLPPTVYDILFWICIPFNTLDIITNAQLLNHRPWRGRMTQHTATVKPNGLCHCDVCFCFLLQITSGIHSRFKARMRTKGCGTISTLSSCSIDPHMGHGPPLLSPCPSPSRYGLRTILVISFHHPGEWPEQINYQLLAAWLYCRPESF